MKYFFAESSSTFNTLLIVLSYQTIKTKSKKKNYYCFLPVSYYGYLSYGHVNAYSDMWKRGKRVEVKEITPLTFEDNNNIKKKIIKNIERHEQRWRLYFITLTVRLVQHLRNDNVLNAINTEIFLSTSNK